MWNNGHPLWRYLQIAHIGMEEGLSKVPSAVFSVDTWASSALTVSTTASMAAYVYMALCNREGSVCI